MNGKDPNNQELHTEDTCFSREFRDHLLRQPINNLGVAAKLYRPAIKNGKIIGQSL